GRIHWLHMRKHPVASVAALLGEPSRAAMLLSLLDGRALPAGELARIAKLSAAATSLHLAKLTQGGVLSVRSEGRHRYYRLASAEVAHALEALGAIATRPVPAATTALSPEHAALRHARSCYDHLAGVLSVELAQAFEREQLLLVEDDRSYTLTPRGADWFGAYLDIDVDLLLASRRVLARRCLDWTERRPHLAGALGAALLSTLIERDWLRRVAGTRQVRLTSRGRAGIARFGFGLSQAL
ncbi:MAG TPA: helix-turn-helix transcriptional regulator, partial [Polyangiales bacterium]